ncbi:LYR motif-containing protein [Tanacetum coccineum]
MLTALRIYGEVLRLVRHLPADSRPYYAKYARENFVNYRELDTKDPAALEEVFHRAYNHSLWVLQKYKVDQGAASKLKEICGLV